MARTRLRRIGLLALIALLLGTFIPAAPGGNAGTARAAGADDVPAADSGYIRLKNMYTGKYLYAHEGKVAYGTPVETDQASHWLIEDAGGKQRIKNRLTGLYMSVENWEGFWSPVELLPVGDDPAVVEWTILDAVTYGHKVIQSAVNAARYLHVQDNNGYAQASEIPPDWGTPQWLFEPVVDYVRLKNSYTGQYLFAADGKAAYGSPDEADPASHWAVETHADRQRIKNRLTGLYLSVENWEGFWSPVELLPAGDDPTAAEWLILDAVTPGLKVFQTAGNPLHYLHVQDNTGYAQASQIPPDWGTPQWAVEQVTVTVPYEPGADDGPAYIRIKNDWLGLYMYDDNGQLKYGNALASDRTSHWIIEDEGDYQRVRNRATGRYISLSGVTSDKTAVAVVETADNRPSEQFIIENLKTEGTKLFRSAEHEDRFLHVEKKLGFVQYGVIPREWGSPKWVFVPVTDDGPKYVRMKNRYTGKYLYEENEMVKYGDPAAEDALSHWMVEDAGGDAKRIKNRSTGHYMNVEGMQSGDDPHLLPLRSTAIEDSWTSAKWTFTVPEEGYTVIENVYQTGSRIHVEDATGYAQASAIPPEWWSAQWALEDAPAQLPVDVPAGYVRLRNAETNAYLYENEHGVVLYGLPEAADARSHWLFADAGGSDGHYRLVNRATGHVVTAEAGEPFLESIAVDVSTAYDQWLVEPAPAEGRVLLRSAARPLEYLHLQDRMGFAQLGLRSIESAAVQWVLETAPADSFIPEPAASSEPVNTGRWDDSRRVRLEHAGSGKTLADTGAGLKAVAAAESAGGQPGAAWLLQDENGYKLLRNAETGRYLGVDGGQPAMAQLADDEAAPPSLKWRLISRSGEALLESVAEPGRYLAVSGGEAGLSAGSAQSPAAELRFKLVPLAQDVVLEGEDAFLAGGASAGADARGFEGGGYAGGFDAAGATAIFAVYADQAGVYVAVIRYANGARSAKRLTLSENGLNARALQFPSTGSWDEWAELKTTLKLRRGINTVAVSMDKGDTGGVLLDNVTVENIVPRQYRGASVSYDLYEAEHAATNGVVIGPDRTYRELPSEASGRQAVKLEHAGDYVEFTLDRPANRLTVRYAIPDSADGAGAETPVGLYIDGVKQDGTVLTSRYAWVYGGYPWTNNPDDGDAHRFYDESVFAPGPLAAGTKVRIRKEADSTAAYIVIDLLEADWADDPYPMPAGFLSIADFGAVADDDGDDTAAIEAAIAAAKNRGAAGVWIPAGTFRVDGGPIEVADITIRGAGKWHATLAGGGFMGVGSRIRVYDLAIDGEVTARRDELPESGFDGTFGTGSTIQHVRIDHVKTGIWATTKEAGGSPLPTDGLYVAGVQIRNTFADGINFSTGTRNSMAEQNQFRNTGDDGMAMWAAGEPAGFGNTFRFNTVELPWLSNNIAVYGGKDIRVTDNVVSDTVAFGAGISVSTRHNPLPFDGTVLVERNTLIRTGGREHNWPADFGGLFLFAGDIDMTGDIRIRDNLIYDSTHQGISFLGEKSTSGIVLENNVVDGAGSWGVNASGNIKGSALFGNTIVRGVRVGEFMDVAGGFEFLTKDGGFSFEPKPFRIEAGGKAAAPFTVEAGRTLQAAALDEQGEPLEGVVWSVADTAIAEVSGDGKVTGKRAGATLLTAQAGGKTRSHSLIVTDSAAPVWPEDAALTAVDRGGGSVAISWPAAQDESGIAAYRVVWDDGFKTAAGTETGLTVAGLAGGRRYTFRVEARDAAGGWTDKPLTIEVRTSGSAPSPGAPGTPGTPGTDGQAEEPGLTEAPVRHTREDGAVVAEVAVRADALRNAWKAMAENGQSTLSIDLGAEETAAEAVIPADVLKEGAEAVPGGAISIIHGGAAYDLPLDAIAALLPEDAAGAYVRVSIEKRGAAQLEQAAGIGLRSGVYAFRLFIEQDGAAEEVHDFGGRYVARTIPVDGEISFATAAGVVYDEAAERWRSVPTVFRILPDGSVAAVIRSVTNSLYAVIDTPRTFADMESHWARDAVHALASKQIVSGVDGVRFAPGETVTRAQFAVMLAAALGLPESETAAFRDVASGTWYSGAVGAAAQYSLVNGYDDGTFRPGERITREQMMALMMRAYRMAAPGAGTPAAELAAYHDADRVSGWAADDVRAAVALGIAQGQPGGMLAPQGTATRAEAAQMIVNLLQALDFMNR